ncbi:MAG: sigma-70 family RNA polymerase sigma factor [Mariniblastus sp.]
MPNGEDASIDHGSISLLITPTRDGDPKAREDLMRELKAYLETTAKRHMDRNLRAKAGSSDIVQQSFIQIIEKFEQFRGENSRELRGWIETIVINEIGRTRRKFHTGKRDAKRERSMYAKTSETFDIVPPDDSRTPSSEAISRERNERLHQVLAELKPDHAEVIRLRTFESLSFKEIGEKMDRSENSASQLWYRAMLKFEAKLNGSEFDSRQE